MVGPTIQRSQVPLGLKDKCKDGTVKFTYFPFFQQNVKNSQNRVINNLNYNKNNPDTQFMVYLPYIWLILIVIVPTFGLF